MSIFSHFLASGTFQFHRIYSSIQSCFILSQKEYNQRHLRVIMVIHYEAEICVQNFASTALSIEELPLPSRSSRIRRSHFAQSASTRAASEIWF